MAIGEMNIGELFSSVLMGKVVDVMGNLEGLANTLCYESWIRDLFEVECRWWRRSVEGSNSLADLHFMCYS